VDINQIIIPSPLTGSTYNNNNNIFSPPRRIAGVVGGTHTRVHHARHHRRVGHYILKYIYKTYVIMEIGYFRCPPSQAGRAVVVAGRANDDDAVVTSGVIIYQGI